VPAFVPGQELSRAFYEEVVRALLDVPHSAALLGTGSDVLGFDTVRSTDHGWGPRMHVFVERGGIERVRDMIDVGLPDEFRDWPVRYGWDDVPVSSHVVVATLDDWLPAHLGFDPRQGTSTVEWLTVPQQVLLELTSGSVFHDGLGELEAAREALAAVRAEAERDVERAEAALGEPGAGDAGELARREAIRDHAAERLAELRAQERAAGGAGGASREQRERAAAAERILEERRRLRTEAAIRLEPAYLTDALGPRPEGLRRGLEWERAVDRVERYRQRFDVRDRDRALGAEPRAGAERAQWRAARRELEALRARLAERAAGREWGASSGIGIER
jgi:hypothetical protein